MFDSKLFIDSVKRKLKTDNFDYRPFKRTYTRPANGEAAKVYTIALNSDLAIRTTEMLPAGTQIKSNSAIEVITSNTEDEINLTFHTGIMEITLLPMTLTETLTTVEIQFLQVTKNQN